MKRRFALLLLIACLAGIAVGLSMARRGQDAYAGREEEMARLRAELAQVAQGLRASDPSTAFKLVAKTAGPAVVQVYSAQVVRNPQPFAPLMARQGVGSGVIFRQDDQTAWVLTNFHVVRAAQRLAVMLDDDREFSAEVVGADDKTDLAVLKIAAKKLVPAVFGDSDKMEVGDWVIAIGSPFRLKQTVTQGILSAKGRRGVTEMLYEDFLQTDAAINPGNSGGPLLNLKGEVIGINTAIVSRDGAFDGIGYAIPSNMAREVAEELIRHGKVERGWVGIVMDPVRRSRLGAAGVYVRSVVPESPAMEAGLAVGDVIVSFDEKTGFDTEDFRRIVAKTMIGKVVDVAVERDGSIKTLRLKVGRQPEMERM